MNPAVAEPQRAFAVAYFIFLLGLLSGCQGGSAPSTPVPAAATPADFSLALSSTSITIPQGGVSPPITVSINAKNGFTNSVQITLANLPSGVTSTPASPRRPFAT
jgi:hypothetical protein